MKKMCIFDTATGSMNIGDQIIMNAFEKEMQDIINQNFCIRISTHTPICHFYQDLSINPMINYLQNCDFKFIAGTNILLKNMMLPLTQWNINSFNCKGYKNVILVGCGLNSNSKKTNLYTKRLYKRILSKEYTHSVRDEETKIFLESLGFKAINTGCPTIWSITPDMCKKIPTKKSKNVIFTLTDYAKDKEQDQKLINILIKEYKKVYFFPQGANDEEYLNEFSNRKDIIILKPNLQSFSDALLNNNCDYVGTRLHAGIFAINHQVRSIIIIVDNRARDMSKSYNFNCIERKSLDNLSTLINSKFDTSININKQNIEIFKNQFRK